MRRTTLSHCLRRVYPCSRQVNKEVRPSRNAHAVGVEQMQRHMCRADLREGCAQLRSKKHTLVTDPLPGSTPFDRASDVIFMGVVTTKSSRTTRLNSSH